MLSSAKPLKNADGNDGPADAARCRTAASESRPEGGICDQNIRLLGNTTKTFEMLVAISAVSSLLKMLGIGTCLRLSLRSYVLLLFLLCFVVASLVYGPDRSSQHLRLHFQFYLFVLLFLLSVCFVGCALCFCRSNQNPSTAKQYPLNFQTSPPPCCDYVLPRN